jgi:hypothetical protein
MAQRMILVDTCVYLRLGRHVHPLLDNAFGADGHMLRIIPDFEQEFARQPRLPALHPWVQEAEYLGNRESPYRLPKKLAPKIHDTAKVVDDCAFEQDIALSRVDVSALAVALLMGIHLATDDIGLRDVAMILGVETLGSVELLRFFVDEGRIDAPSALAVLDHLRTLPDLPASFGYDCGRLFPEFNPK